MSPVTGGNRRQARERALGLLYEAELKEETPSSLLPQLPVTPDTFVVELVSGVSDNAKTIDSLIDSFAVDWPLERMPAVDRNVLRLAVFELLERPDVPVGAVISEAVELAKSYSTEQSGRFVNGVLGSIASEVRRARPDAGKGAAGEETGAIAGDEGASICDQP